MPKLTDHTDYTTAVAAAATIAVAVANAHSATNSLDEVQTAAIAAFEDALKAAIAVSPSAA